MRWLMAHFFILRMIIESFYQKADLERWLEPALDRRDYQVLMDAIWKPLVEKNLRYISNIIL
jgi:hypothetical protein